MKLFVLYAFTTDGVRDFLWAKMLPANFNWQAWAESRKEAMRVLGIARFAVEEIAL